MRPDVMNYVYIGVAFVMIYFAFTLLRRNPEKIEDQTDQMRRQYNINDPVIVALFKKWASAVRTAFLHQKQAEIKGAVEIREAKDRVDWQHELDKETQRTAVDSQVLQQDLIAAAKTNQMDVPSLVEVNKEGKILGHKVWSRQQESNIATREYEQKKIADVEADYNIRINQLKAVLALKTFPYMQLAEIRKLIEDLLLEDARVAADEKYPASAKAEYRMLLQDTIVVYRRQYERGLGRLQGIDERQELGTTDGFAELGIGVEDINETADDEV